nr:unnamed protein product [Callosobruchus chinensis]
MCSRGHKLLQLALAEKCSSRESGSDPASEAEVNMLGNNSMSLHTTSVTNSSTAVDPSNNFEEQILLDGVCVFPSNTTEIIQEMNNEELSEVVSDCFFGTCDIKSEPTNLQGVQRQNCIPLVNPTNTESEEEPIDDSDKDPNYSPSCTDKEDFDKENPNGLDIVHSDSEENTVRRPLKPRKRTRCEDKWKSTIRMMHTISGKAHKSKTGKQIEAKVMKEGCAQCKKRCTERINQHTRENIFENYWSGSKSWDIKRQFILAHVKSKPPSRKRPVDGSRGIQRKQTISYSLTINNESVAVCKVFFLNTLGISETVVRNALKKQEVGGFVSMDMRGRHVPANKIPEHVRDRVRSHIRSFPAYESHYSRTTTSKQFLGSELSIEKMYCLYKEKCSEEAIPKSEIVKSWFYRHTFKTEFNLSFKVPSVDTCDQCDTYKVKIQESSDENEKLQLSQDHNHHLMDAENRYSAKKTR